MNRQPSREYASAVKSTRLVASESDEQPQLKPALLRFSAMICQCFTRAKFCPFCFLHSKFVYLALDTVLKGDTRYCSLAAARSPSLIASASLTYLPFLVVP
jgi:hypothetical protein